MIYFTIEGKCIRDSRNKLSGVSVFKGVNILSRSYGGKKKKNMTFMLFWP